MKAIKVIALGILFFVSINGQQEYKIMSYNLLNYPGNDTTTRNPYFRTVIAKCAAGYSGCTGNDFAGRREWFFN